MKKLVVVGMAFACAMSAAAVTREWKNTSGDYDLGNAANWGGTLPGVEDYAKISVGTTKENPAALVTTNELFVDQIEIGLANQVLDLGTGNRFTANKQAHFNSSRTVTLKSGTFGVDWEATGDGRFFLGNNSVGGGTLVVDGPDAVLTGSKKNMLQHSLNQPNYLLKVVNGGTVQANVGFGNTTVPGSNGVMWVEGPGSRHIVPSDSTVKPLVIGRVGGGHTYVLTNQATCKIENAQDSVLSCWSQNTYTTPIPGNNRMRILDRSTFDSNGSIFIGQDGCTNLIEVSGGSTVKCAHFKISPARDSHMPAVFVCDNEAHITGEGTTLVAANDVSVGGSKANRSKLVVDDGAKMTVGQTFVVGESGSSDGLAYFGTNTVVDFYRHVMISSDNNASGTNNQIVADHAALFVTNATASTGELALRVGSKGCGNSLVLRNGATLYMTNASIVVGNSAGADSNVLTVAGGSLLTLDNPTLKHQTYIGNFGAYCGFLIDNATVRMPQEILRVNSHCWARLKNGADWKGYRLIMGEGASDSEFEVDNSRFETKPGSIQIGHAQDTSFRHLFHIHGSNAYVRCGTDGASLGKDCVLKFTVERDGFKNNPVFSLASTFKQTNPTDTDHPATVKIEVAEDNYDGGTFTLMKSDTSQITWTNVNLEYDPERVRIVKQDTKELTVHVRRLGLMLLLR